MLRNINNYHENPDINIVALEVVGGVTTADVDEFERQFAQKLAEGHKEVNVLVNLAQLDTKKTSMRAALQERIWGAKNLGYMANVALVANERRFGWLKTAILLEAWLLMKLNKNAHEKYFDIANLDKAIAFVEARGLKK